MLGRSELPAPRARDSCAPRHCRSPWSSRQPPPPRSERAAGGRHRHRRHRRARPARTRRARRRRSQRSAAPSPTCRRRARARSSPIRSPRTCSTDPVSPNRGTPNIWPSLRRNDRHTRASGDDAVVAGARGRAGHHPSAAEGRVRAGSPTDLIVETGRIVARDLRDRFGIARPRLAVAGLNPHAGEEGALGDGGPAASSRRRSRKLAPRASTRAVRCRPTRMFHAAARATYDAALCMYHDQALIPIKTLAFDHAVNVTLGLPFVRTSPDHGTAFDIAGTGRADPSSLIAALRLAARLVGEQRAAAARTPRMSAIDDLPPLREVIRRHGLARQKSLGQNFLLDLNLTARIARAAGPLEGVSVIEIGPGPGGLTRALLAQGARACRRDRARRARHRGARRDRRALSRAGWRSSPATPSSSTRAPHLGRCRRASSPTCPTTSPPRCWSAGSPPSPGRPGTIGWC